MFIYSVTSKVSSVREYSRDTFRGESGRGGTSARGVAPRCPHPIILSGSDPWIAGLRLRAAPRLYVAES